MTDQTPSPRAKKLVKIKRSSLPTVSFRRKKSPQPPSRPLGRSKSHSPRMQAEEQLTLSDSNLLSALSFDAHDLTLKEEDEENISDSLGEHLSVQSAGNHKAPLAAPSRPSRFFIRPSHVQYKSSITKLSSISLSTRYSSGKALDGDCGDEQSNNNNNNNNNNNKYENGGILANFTTCWNQHCCDPRWSLMVCCIVLPVLIYITVLNQFVIIPKLQMMEQSSEPGSSVGGHFNQRNPRPEQVAQVRAWLEQQGVSDPGVFASPDSPQSKALLWMAHSIFTNPQVALQRYALAVLYYSTGGDTTTSGTTTTSTTKGGLLAALSKTLQSSPYEDGIISASASSTWIDQTHWMIPTAPVCSWFGVECDPAHDVVIGLNLTRNGLMGTLPLHEIYSAMRTTLAHLDLSHNGLGGSIHATTTTTSESNITSWPALKTFWIQDNVFTGMPPLGHVLGLSGSILEDWNVAQNVFQSTLPQDAFVAWTNLRSLQISQNKLAGPVPALGHLSELTSLIIENNEFTALPRDLYNLSKLAILKAGSNKFASTFPVDVFYLPSLQTLGLEINGLKGRLEDRFTQLPNLVELRLHENRFSGTLPSSLSTLRSLAKLTLSNNQFSGTIPSGFAELNRLQSLLLVHNELVGSVPVELCRKKAGMFNANPLHYLAVDCDEVICNCCDRC